MKVPMVIVHFALAGILAMQGWELKELISLDVRLARVETKLGDHSAATLPLRTASELPDVPDQAAVTVAASH